MPSSPRAAKAVDLVRFQGQRYSPDVRNGEYMSSSHATTTSSNGWSTKKIAILAMLCAASAISTMVLQFPIIPGVTFLKYDPSGIFALLAGVTYGPAAGAVVSTLPYLLHLTTESGIYGTLMAILATLTYVLPVSCVVYNHVEKTKQLIPALIIGSVVSVVACILGNLVVTPIYTGMSVEAVESLILPALLPFNVVKVVINSVIFTLLVNSASSLFKSLKESEQ